MFKSSGFRYVLAVLIAAVTALVQPPAHAQEARRVADWIEVEVGQSRVLQAPTPYKRLELGDPAVANAKPMDDLTYFSVLGLEVGTTDLWVWPKSGGEPLVYQILVQQDLSDLSRRVAEIVKTSQPPKVYPLKDRLVIEGPVADLETMERIASVAQIYDPDFVNLMTVLGDQQVQLEVVFAEVSRTAMRDMGLNFLWGDDARGAGIMGPNTNGAGGSALLPGSFAGTNIGGNINGGVVPAAAGADTFSIMGVVSQEIGSYQLDLAAVMSVLEQYNVSKILAEPTLVALSGQQAEFLAGGEVPIPVNQQGNRISVEFKEYGIKLVFVPTVLSGEVIDLRVYIEVSEIDASSGTRVIGIEIPGFLTRKGESHLRIAEGKTFAMAGLLSERVEASQAKVPILGEIPILGTLFRYTSHQRDETELMIFVTPRLVRPLAPEEIPPLPGSLEDNNPNDFELFWLGRTSRLEGAQSEPSGPTGMQR